MKFRVDKLSRIFLKEDRQLFEGVERDELYNLIFNPDNWEINNYDSFLNSLAKTPQKYRGFITDHPKDELSQPEWKTFKLKNIDAGFALHYVDKGKVDICNLHNNSNIKGISDMMLTFAKRQGGTMLDNYAGFLGDKYQKNGFDNIVRINGMTNGVLTVGEKIYLGFLMLSTGHILLMTRNTIRRKVIETISTRKWTKHSQGILFLSHS